MSFRGRLSAGEGEARCSSRRSRPHATQEHRRTGARLFAASRRARSAKTDRQRRRRKRAASGRRWLAAALAARLACALASLAGVAGGTWLKVRPRDETAKAPRLSVVVLPFKNLSGDREHDYFADGITDDLTTDLSRIWPTASSSPIARRSPTRASPWTLSRSARTSAYDMCLKAASPGGENRFRSTRSLFELRPGRMSGPTGSRREISTIHSTSKIKWLRASRMHSVTSLSGRKLREERRIKKSRRDGSGNAGPGPGVARQPPTKDDKNGAARAFFEQALQIDPNDPGCAGRVRPATYAGRDFRYGSTSSEIDYEARDNRASRSGDLARSRRNIRFSYQRPATLSLTQHWSDALIADAGLAVDPNFAALYRGARGSGKFLGSCRTGEIRLAARDAVEPARSGVRLLARPIWAMSALNAGELSIWRIDEYHQRDRPWISHIHSLRKSRRRARATGNGGPVQSRALAEALRLKPDLTMKWFVAHAPNLPKLFEGYRKAGLPEE